MLLIGSHVRYNSSTGLLGSLNEAMSYGANCFMIYTGAPSNTARSAVLSDKTNEALELMQKNNIDIKNIIAHAPYIVNPANKLKEQLYEFSIEFLTKECKRCELLNITKLVIHPGSHVGCGREEGIKNIINAINNILLNTNITILLETMAGKGSEMGSILEEIRDIIKEIDYQDRIGICLDTCHLNDAGYDVGDFDSILDILEEYNILDKVGCVHVNDSKNIKGSHKDRHENIGFGSIGFDNLINIIYNPRLENIPKILETPYIDEKAPYKEEIDMIKKKEFDVLLKGRL